MLRRWRQRAGACLPSPPHGKDACVEIRAYHNTHYVPVHNIAVNPPDEKEVCGKMCAYHNTHYVPVHNISGTSCVRITTHITCRCTTKRSPPHGNEACVKTPAYHNTHSVSVHNIAFDEKPAFGGDTRHR